MSELAADRYVPIVIVMEDFVKYIVCDESLCVHDIKSELQWYNSIYHVYIHRYISIMECRDPNLSFP